MFKLLIDYILVPHSKGGEFESVKKTPKRHNWYAKLGNVGQLQYVHEDSILLAVFP